jgi:hypothetical protein
MGDAKLLCPKQPPPMIFDLSFARTKFGSLAVRVTFTVGWMACFAVKVV